MKHVRGVYRPSRVLGEKSWNGTSVAGTIRRTVATADATTVECQRVRRTVTRSTIRLDDTSVPRRCALDGFAEEVALTEGVDLAEPDSLTTLLVRTENSLYRIIVLQPPQPNILVQGGGFAPRRLRAGLPARVSVEAS